LIILSKKPSRAIDHLEPEESSFASDHPDPVIILSKGFSKSMERLRMCLPLSIFHVEHVIILDQEIILIFGSYVIDHI
jgi:hypothetical protein